MDRDTLVKVMEIVQRELDGSAAGDNAQAQEQCAKPVQHATYQIRTAKLRPNYSMSEVQTALNSYPECGVLVHWTIEVGAYPECRLVMTFADARLFRG